MSQICCILALQACSAAFFIFEARTPAGGNLRLFAFFLAPGNARPRKGEKLQRVAEGELAGDCFSGQVILNIVADSGVTGCAR